MTPLALGWTRSRAWLDRRPALQFVLLAVAFMALFQLAFTAFIAHSGAFQSYLALNARSSSGILNLFGEQTTTAGTSISALGGSVDIARGCDGIQAGSLFAIAVLVFPVGFGRRILGAVVGVLVLLLLNLVRIVTLFLMQVHSTHELFELGHKSLWPMAFMLVSIVLWALWARWAMVPPTSRA